MIDVRLNRRQFVGSAAVLGMLGVVSPLIARAAESSAEDAADSAAVDAQTGLADIDSAVIQTNDDGSRVLNDAIGEITVPEESFRIATMAPAHTTGVLLLGGADKLVALEENFGKNEWIKSKYPQLDDLPVVFASNETNTEELLNQSPDLVCYATRYGEDILKQLQDLGIAVASGIKTSDDGDYDHIYRVRDNAVYWGYVIGGTQLEKAEQYREEYTQIREDIAALTADLADEEKPTVVEVSAAGDQLQVNNGTAIGQELIELAGGINAAEDAAGESAGPSGQTIVDPEQLLEYNPDILLVDSASILETLQADSVLSELDAIKNGKVYIIPSGAMSWSYNGAEEYLNMYFFAKAIQPSLFEDIDMEQLTRDFYENYFGFEITDDDLTTLYNLADGETVADVFNK